MDGIMNDLLNAFISNDNKPRKEAELYYNAMKSENPRLTILELVKAMSNSTKPEHRILSSIMLRNTIIRDKAMWESISMEEMVQIRQQLIQALVSETQVSTQRKIANCVAAHAGLADWPELMNGIVSLHNSNDEKQKQLCLYLLDKLAEHVGGVLVHNLHSTLSIIVPCLDVDRTIETRVAAAIALCSIAFEIENEANTNNEISILLANGVLAVLNACFANGDESLCQDMLTSIGRLVKAKGALFQKACPVLLPLLQQICQFGEFEEVSRIMALEICLDLITNTKANCSTNQTRGAFLRLTMDLMTCVEEESGREEQQLTTRPDIDNSFGDVDGDNGETLTEFAAVCLDKLVHAILGKETVNHCLPYASSMLHKADWQSRRAAYFIVATICSGAHDELEPHVPQLIHTVVEGLSDQHHRVRFAALYCLSILIDEYSSPLDEEDDEEGDDDQFGGKEQDDDEEEDDDEDECKDESFQHKFHQLIVPAVCSSIQNNASSFPRNVYIGLVVLKAFFNPDRCRAHCCAPYSVGILEFCYNVLMGEASNSFIKEEAASVFGNVSLLSTQDVLLPRYSSIMTTLKAIISAPVPPSENPHTYSLLKGKCLECFALVGKAVGAQVFAEESISVLLYLSACHESGLDFSDPLSSYMIQACARIAGAIGAENFAVFVPKLIPPLISRIAEELSVNISLEDEPTSNGESDGIGEGESTTSIYKRGVGVVSVTCNTHQIIEKEMACRVLYQYCLDIPTLVWQYTSTIVSALLPNLSSTYMSDDLAMVTGSLLVEILKLHLKHCSPDQSSVSLSEQMINASVEALVASLEKLQLAGGHDETTVNSVSHQLLDHLRELLKLVWDSNVVTARIKCHLESSLAAPLVKFIRDEIVLVIQNRFVNGNRASENQRDDDEEDDESYWNNLLDTMGWTIKLYGQQLDSVFVAEVLPLMTGLLVSCNQSSSSSSHSALLSMALGTILDAIEYIEGSQCAAMTMEKLVPILLHQLIQPDLCICCAYGLGVVAQYGGESFRGGAQVAVGVLQSVLSRLSNICDDDDDLASLLNDNIVSSLLKLCVYRGEEIPVSTKKEIMNFVLSHLPCRADLHEARACHELFVRLLETKDARIMESDLLPQTFQVMVKLAMFGDVVEMEKKANDFDFWNNQILYPRTLTSITRLLMNWLQSSSFCKIKSPEPVLPHNVVDQLLSLQPSPIQKFLSKFGSKHGL